VGDVEILYIPRFEDRRRDMFALSPANLADEAIEALLLTGVLRKRPSKTKTFAWGVKNKLALHRSGIPVDLFAATPENWFNYLVCRTGPADSNTRIAMEAQKRGWKWNPYGNGFSRGGVLAGPPEEHVVRSERDVFEFVGLPYAEPEERK
jgi:DNA polymerase/3'-5' exonuclease PolX